MNELAPLPTERTKQIITLAQEALGGAEEVRKRTRLSIEAAKKCGKLLTEEREAITRQAKKRGQWLSYYDSHFAHIIPLRTAQHWMKINAIAPSHTPELKGTSETAPTVFTNPNETRLGMLALDLFPKKKPVEVAGDAPTPRTDSHLAIVNRFVAWHTNLKQRSSLGRLSVEERNQLLADFGPIVEFVHQLEAL